jgi:secreted trypsin-like serine protease
MRGAVLCAAGARGEQACFGDSGGPLVTYADADNVPTVIGVVSAGVKCGRTAIPSRFTRIGHPRVQRWINSILPPVTRR